MTDPAGWPVWLWLLVDALAVHRLARLLTHDRLPPVARLRDTLLTRWGESPWSEVLVCTWCIGPHIGVAVLAATVLAPTVWAPLAVVLAWSSVAGLLSARE